MNKKQRIMVIALILFLAGNIYIGQACAASNILFILDVSGRMAGKFPNQTKLADPNKIQITQEVLVPLLADLPKDVNIGIEVFGHYGEKDCSAIELINPVLPLDVPALSANMQKLSPERGAIPLAKALEQGAAALKELTGNKTIVLITNGDDTCGGNPEEVVNRVKEEDKDLTIHVLGVDILEEDQKKLSAIAEASSGQYYAVNNADDLEKSLLTIKEKGIDKIPEHDVLFRDDFSNQSLSDDWEIINQNTANISIKEGVLKTVLSKLNPKKVDNVLQLKLPIPENDWIMKANFNSISITHTVDEVFELGVANKDSTQRMVAQIQINTDKNAISKVILKSIKQTKKSLSNVQTELFSNKSKGLKQRSDFFKDHIRSITLKLQKSGTNYITSAKLEPITRGDEAVSPNWVVVQTLHSPELPGDAFFIKTYAKKEAEPFPKKIQGIINLNWVEVQLVKPIVSRQK